MALFDTTLLFFHAGTAYTFSAGEYVNLAGATSTSTSLNGTAINLGTARDLGIGDGEFIPHIDVVTGTAITSACTSLTINVQFQGSTDSVSWSTYMESGALTTASFGANTGVPLSGDPIPRRLPGLPLPLYYRLNLQTVGMQPAATTISAGTLIGGIVIQAPASAGTLDQYPAGFSVA